MVTGRVFAPGSRFGLADQCDQLVGAWKRAAQHLDQFGDNWLGQIVLPDWLYAALLLLNLLSLVGVALYLFQTRNNRAAQSEMPGAIQWKGALILGFAGCHDCRVDLVWSG